MKEFKVGKTVYWGTLKGKVTSQSNDDTSTSLSVKFKDIGITFFTKDGRYLKNTPVVLSHFPYEMEMKQVEPVIKKDTKVWYRDGCDDAWKFGYYSHFEDKFHFIFSKSQKSTETNETLGWNIVVTEDPLS